MRGVVGGEVGGLALRVLVCLCLSLRLWMSVGVRLREPRMRLRSGMGRPFARQVVVGCGGGRWKLPVSDR